MRGNVALLLVLIVVAGCAPSGPSGRGGSVNQPSGGATNRVPKSIALAIRDDPKNLWESILGGGMGGSRQLGPILNQYLVVMRADARPEPRLLAELPSLEKGTWKVLPDGKMETLWKLRTDAFWHDQTPLTAEDIVFSIQVNRDPEVPNPYQAVPRLIEAAEAVGSHTVRVTWSETYPYADQLEDTQLIPVARHLVERPYREAKDTLLSQPHFSEEWVGLGPYKLVQWVRGSHMELAAFDRFFMGPPKIDSIRVQFVADQNTMLANLRAGTLHMVLPQGEADFEEMMLLKREWEAAGRGTVIAEASRWVFVEPQKRAMAQPADLTDLRVRQALQHAIDRPELARAMAGDLGLAADSWVHPSFPEYPVVERSLVRYPYDVNRAKALMAEAGWAVGSDGVLQKSGERFDVQVRFRSNTHSRPAAIVRDNWRALGIQGDLAFLPDTVQQDRAARATFSGVDIANNPMGGLNAAKRLSSQLIPTAENRYNGSNRGG